MSCIFSDAVFLMLLHFGDTCIGCYVSLYYTFLKDVIFKATVVNTGTNPNASTCAIVCSLFY